MNIYLLSGIGTDTRVFEFLDLYGHTTHHITWVLPRGDETIEAYTHRLLPQIKHANPVLVGVSFGGMIAIELGKLIATEKIIIISSIQTRSDVPLRYRIVGKLGLHAGVPTLCFKRIRGLVHWLFSTEQEVEKKFLNRMIAETDTNFLEWAIDQIPRWTNESTLENVVHIHGTHDRIFPVTSGPCIKIDRGGHLMIIGRAGEISDMIRKILRSHEEFRASA